MLAMTKDFVDPSGEPPANSVASLEATLAQCSTTVRESLERARSLEEGCDIYERDKNYERALGYAQAIARVGLALGKLRARHAVKIDVTRKTLEPGLDPAVEYARKAGDEAFWKRWHDLFDREEAAADAEEERVSKNGGSNDSGS